MRVTSSTNGVTYTQHDVSWVVGMAELQRSGPYRRDTLLLAKSILEGLLAKVDAELVLEEIFLLELSDEQ